MDLRGNYTKCLSDKSNVRQNPRDACYMLTFNTADQDILPNVGEDIELTFDIYVVHAKVKAKDHTTKVITNISGNKAPARLHHGPQA